jgi:hypothetical protein
MIISEGKFCRTINGIGYAARVVANINIETENSCISTECNGCGYASQGYIEESTATGLKIGNWEP